MNIVLCGMMGSGKTTVARILSYNLGREFVDTDEVIEKRYGSISEIFGRYGEERFRDEESTVVREVATIYKNAVISLGGGCVLRAVNVENLRKTGKIVYLCAQPQTLIARLREDCTRPLLSGDTEGKINSILASRKALYEGAADFIVQTDDKTPEEIAQIIEDMNI